MNDSEYKKYVYIGVVVGLALIFVLRLIQLQLLDPDYKHFAQSQAIRRVIQYPARGGIVDRYGIPLVTNEDFYDLMVVPALAKPLDTAEFCRLTDIDKAEFIAKFAQIDSLIKKKKLGSRQPFTFIKEMTKESVAPLEEKMYKFEGYYLQPRILRRYPLKIAPHVLGYIAEADTALTRRDSYYKPGDYVGISGIEKAYEEVLRGRKGVKHAFVDVHNNLKGSYMNGAYDTSAVPGQDLAISLDAELQAYGERLMRNKRGAIVALEPATGEILALISSPSYDPNLLVGRGIRKYYPLLARDSLKPLYNRAIMDGYPPGSTFKLLHALIAQQMGVLSPSTVYPCGGGFSIGSHVVKCHPHGGPTDLRQAIQISCNSYFCRVFTNIITNTKEAEKHYTIWRKYITAFGIGEKMSDTDIPHLKAGLVPRPEYYDRYHGKGRWKAFTIISLGIGQGELKANVLHLANMAAAIANRGWWITPHLVKKIGRKPVEALSLFRRHETGIDTAYFRPVVEGMERVILAGTGRIARIDSISLCGKTGTAQNPHGEDHSIFVCFAPKENPKIALAVFIENAGFGATWAAPIASLMVEFYLKRRISRPHLEERMLNANLLFAK
ncbi:MAG: penicillin-binding transpeptidase domain-containing protein [Flavobacteriales bacterium]|nr:penicillin-binding transpeptidase domain-containing protein [Flavobacteriales bacterium]MDW8410565.1 penicillin-binding transpeptidase domain-containing protein [Flavobacteriales bacterium]